MEDVRQDIIDYIVETIEGDTGSSVNDDAISIIQTHIEELLEELGDYL